MRITFAEAIALANQMVDEVERQSGRVSPEFAEIVGNLEHEDDNNDEQQG